MMVLGRRFSSFETYLGENTKTVYSLVWGQCTDVMRQRIEATSNFKQLSSNGDGLGLLMAIKDLVYNFQSKLIEGNISFVSLEKYCFFAVRNE
jgi:hypothetical protein